MTNEVCKHEFMAPYIEERENRFGRMKRHSIWMCEKFGCGHKEDREYVEIFFQDKETDFDTADDIRVLRILSSHLNKTPKEVLEILKQHHEDNPLNYQDECVFWTEKK